MTETAPRPAFLPPGFDTPETLPAPCREQQGVVTYSDIEVAAPVGFRPLRMDVRVPARATGPVPVVAYIHGGAFRFGSRRENAVARPTWSALLERGLAVAALEYRLSGEAPFPACLHDVKAAIRWLRRYGDLLGVRGDAIGAWGESAGAHLAAFLALNSTDPALNGGEGVTGISADVQAAVAWYPPTRFLTMDAEAPATSAMSHDAPESPESQLVGGPLQENREAAAFASPVTHVRAGAAPILLMHGRLDRLVPYPQSVAMAEALRGVGADVRLELVPDADHVFQGVDVAPLAATSADFLAERLG